MIDQKRMAIARILHNEVFYPGGRSPQSGREVLPFDDQPEKWKNGLAEMEPVTSILAVLNEENE